MSLIGEQTLLRIHLHSADRAPRTPTYQRLIRAARKRGMAGATVLKGIMGFGLGLTIGESFPITGQAAWPPAAPLPIIVEIVDRAEAIAAFIAGELPRHPVDFMATLERAAVMMYRQRSDSPSGVLQAGSIYPPLSTVPRIGAGGPMTVNENGVLLRIFIGESDRFESMPLHEAILQRARRLGLAGATVLRGVEGFGANSVVHKATLLEMSADLPIVIEIVDAEPAIRQLLPDLEKMVAEGMITMEQVMILMYRHNISPAK